jgi:septal ring factor EnvC (AmiA/AmiB activator)
VQTKSALNSANGELQKARTDLKGALDELVSLRKQYSEQQMALGQLQAEMANARAFVEAEKAVSARLREDIAKMKEEFAHRPARRARARRRGRPGRCCMTRPSPW